MNMTKTPNLRNLKGFNNTHDFDWIQLFSQVFFLRVKIRHSLIETMDILNSSPQILSGISNCLPTQHHLSFSYLSQNLGVMRESCQFYLQNTSEPNNHFSPPPAPALCPFPPIFTCIAATTPNWSPAFACAPLYSIFHKATRVLLRGPSFAQCPLMTSYLFRLKIKFLK